MKSSLLLVVVAFAATLAANAQTTPRPAAETPGRVAPPPIPQTTPSDKSVAVPADKNAPPLDLKNMDTSVKPQDDFYLYANGGWIKSNPIPPEFARWGSFNMLAEQNNDALKIVAEKAAAAASTTAAKSGPEKATEADVKRVGDFYASGMNEAAIDSAKAQPLVEELKRIDAMKEPG